MPASKPRYLRVIYYDRDARTCNASRILTNDLPASARTCKLQRTDRNVNLSSTEPQKDRRKVPSIQSLMSKLPAGYRHDPTLSW